MAWLGLACEGLAQPASQLQARLAQHSSHLISVARLCIAQGVLLDFVFIRLPHCLLIWSNDGVEDPLKCQFLDLLCFLLISIYAD